MGEYDRKKNQTVFNWAATADNVLYEKIEEVEDEDTVEITASLDTLKHSTLHLTLHSDNQLGLRKQSSQHNMNDLDDIGTPVLQMRKFKSHI